MTRKNTTLLAGLAGALIVAPALAFAVVNVGDTLGVSESEIRAQLEKDGYTVTEFEMEDGEIEVYATKDGQTFEFELSESGQVLEIELEDPTEDSDD